MAQFSGCGVHELPCDDNNTVSPPAHGMPHESDFEVAIELYLTSLVGIVGLLGNIVSLIVLRQDRERRETLLLLQVLAASDTLYVVMALLLYPLKYLVTDAAAYHHMKLYVFPLLKTFQAITIWMLVLVTVDRYIYVCKPLRAKDIFNKRTRRVFAVLVFVFGVLFSLPRFFDSCVMTFRSCDRFAVHRVVPKEEFINTYYYNVYKYGLFIAVLYVIPLTILFVMNIRLIVAIRRSRRRHCELRVQGYSAAGNHSYSSHTEHNATLVLIIIILVFIVCETPECLLRIFSALDHNGVLDVVSPAFYRCNTASALLLVLNSSVNFFIYFVFGKRFRYILKETFIYKLQSSMTLQTRETVPLNRNLTPLRPALLNIGANKQQQQQQQQQQQHRAELPMIGCKLMSPTNNKHDKL